jgi:hypothetical protein
MRGGNVTTTGAFPLVEGVKCQVEIGAACRSRTDDLLITNQLLYQLS